MVDIKSLSNNKVGWFVGPSTAVPTANWTSGPTLAQLQSLLNISEAAKIDGTDFGLEASDQSDDRSFVDAAGSQSRSFDQASGNIEIYTPAAGDVSSIYVQAWNAISKTRTKLVLGQRMVKSASSAIAAGDEINLFSVMTDDRQHNRNDVSRTLGIGLLPQGNILSNYIVPAAAPATITVAPQGGKVFTALVAGVPAFTKVTYQGRNITIGAKYVSSNEAVIQVRHGVVIPIAAGTATLTVSYPGAATLAGIPVTVT